MTNETWKPVIGWEGLYEVSDLGRVRSVRRWIESPAGSYWHKGKVLAASRAGGWKYLRVRLRYAGRIQNVCVHRLVLEAFVGPCPSGQEALHWDDDPTNNRPGNLRWGTRSENVRDQVQNGRHWLARRDVCDEGHPLDGVRKVGGRYCKTCERERARVRRGQRA